MHSPIYTLRENRNCWRLATAQRAAFLIDGEAYFSALAAAIERAQRSIVVLGWDIDSRARLLQGPHPRSLPTRFGEFLNAIVSRRRHLHAYLLGWDFSMIYLFERELMPSYKLGWRTHRRVHFWLDSSHPLGASHHQKVVVIDDAVAFAGGFDIAIRRWDTPAHQPSDPARVDPAGVPYKPFHDVQVMVDGDAARALGELARERWRRATGEALTAYRTDSDPWPSAMAPDLTDARVAIARTLPEYNGYPAVQEVRQLHLDLIAATRRHLYIENQYFTSPVIGAALAARLREPEGPEIVLVVPYKQEGWLEESTMGLLRARVIRDLIQADRYNHLRVYYAQVRDTGQTYVQVHSKVIVVDEAIARVGSSNLSNRSMGFDTECDVAIEAGGDARIAGGIARFRDRLLAEHLGASIERVADAFARAGSLIAAIETLRGGAHSLEPLAAVLPASVTVPEPLLIDPERPVAAEELIAEFVPEDVRETADHRVLRNILLLITLIGIAAAWRWTPLAHWLDIDTITGWTERLSTHPAGPLAILAAYAFGGLIFFPVTLLIAATAFSFHPFPGFVFALLGCVLSAVVNYGVGRMLGQGVVTRLAGPRLQRLHRRLIHRGLITMITVRMVPVAPFGIINLVAGALRIRFRDLVLGTAIGMAPGILAISVFTEGIANLIRRPGPDTLAVLAATAVVIAVAALWFRRWLSRADNSSGAAIQHKSR